MTAKKFRIIETAMDIDAGVRALRRKCPAIKEAHTSVGRPPLRRYQPGLAGLARIVVAQQVSTASANAIWNRLDTVIGTWQADSLTEIDTETLRSAGLSRPKIKTLKALAAELTAGRLNLNMLNRTPDEQVHEALTSVSGIGPWTADIYLMFCLGRADAFAPGDLALMTATEHLMHLDARPDRTELSRIAERWRPWRGVAARLLWAWHPTIKAAGQ